MSGVRSVTHDQSGFTLMELLFVVMIIGILILIVLGTYRASAVLAQKVSCEANVRTIRQSIVLYRHANGTNPTQLTDLSPTYVNAGGLRCPATKNFYSYEPISGRAWCSIHDF